MNRYDILDKVNVAGEIKIDLCNDLLHRYVFRRYTWHKVMADEIGAPDLIAFREYGMEGLDWAIMLANSIENPFSGFIEGDLIKIPDRQEILDLRRSLVPMQINDEPDVEPASKTAPSVDDRRYIMP